MTLPTPAAADAAIAAALAAGPAGATAAGPSSVRSRLSVETRRASDAVGRVLAEDVHAERDQPPFDRVAMDGIAIASAAWRAGRREFRIAGTQAAGAPPLALDSQDHCLEAMTGAVLPPGADAVIPVEQLEIAAGVARVRAELAVEPFVNVHRRGSDTRAGARVLAAGDRLRGPEIAILASAGRTSVTVARDPSIAVVSTGDELVDAGAPIADWQIRRSNVHGVVVTLRARGYASVVDDHVPDEPATIVDRLGTHLAAHDVLVLSGGVSAGKFDHVPAALTELGVRRVFHKIAQRPGRPFWFGVTDAGRAVFALPGNPVSTLVCLVRYVLPALDRLRGAEPPPPASVVLAADHEVRTDLTVFLPVDLAVEADGVCRARPHPTNGSGDFTSLSGTAGFVELGPARRWQRGEAVPFRSW